MNIVYKIFYCNIFVYFALISHSVSEIINDSNNASKSMEILAVNDGGQVVKLNILGILYIILGIPFYVDAGCGVLGTPCFYI